MAKPPVTLTPKADIGNDAKELFAEFLTHLKSKLKPDSRIFPSGIISLLQRPAATMGLLSHCRGRMHQKVENLAPTPEQT
jgi:hypothetical protein